DFAARVLVREEPTSSLDQQEVAQLFELMRRLKEQGIAIVFISHFLEQVYEVADRITVLRNGRLVGEWPTAALPRAELVSKMLGRELETLEALERRTHETREHEVGTPGLDARGVAP